MFSDGLFSRTGLPKLLFPRGQARTVGSGTVILFRNQKLVDFQIFSVDDFKFVSRVNQKIGAFRDFAQGIHHKASDGFVVFRIGKFLNVQRAHDVGERGRAVHQPGIFGAADDLRLFFGIDQLAHDDAHHVFQRYYADHQRVFVHHHGKVFAGSFKGFQYIVKRQRVWDEQGFAQHALVSQADVFFFWLRSSDTASISP